MEIKSLADSVKNLQNLMNSVKRADAADGSIEDSPLVGLSDSWFSRKIEVNWARKYLYWALLLFGCIFARVFQTRLIFQAEQRARLKGCSQVA